MSDQTSDQRKRKERGAEARIALAFGTSTLGAVGFAVVYVLGGQTQLEGAALAVAFGGLAAGLALWAAHLLPSGGYVEEHHGFSSGRHQQEKLAEQLDSSGGWRRRSLLGMLTVAVGSIAAAALFPLRSLLQPRGEDIVDALSTTPWRSGGLRLVDGHGEPVRVDDVTEDTILTVYPEGHPKAGDAPAFLVRLEPERFTTRPPGGVVADGVVAYSLLCTHAGCPVSLLVQGTSRLLCPCHQSAFDLLDAAKPVSGPAGRPLPGLPIFVDDDGYLRARGDFTAPPGPGFWSRP
ncbi:ubiquinol-cytochrome c reductase iron-sulfur subunit [Actinophytocola glycyrrhizae]|uniref:Cytochrome bc1 complex Rieske iron-sulfur subunit n=1 Tax=Actinophytocola glycyrrhizae TaxID=2044873 RepID=A0ABV9SG99_9PSEU